MDANEPRPPGPPDRLRLLAVTCGAVGTATALLLPLARLTGRAVADDTTVALLAAGLLTVAMAIALRRVEAPWLAALLPVGATLALLAERLPSRLLAIAAVAVIGGAALPLALRTPQRRRVALIVGPALLWLGAGAHGVLRAYESGDYGQALTQCLGTQALAALVMLAARGEGPGRRLARRISWGLATAGLLLGYAALTAVALHRGWGF
jgi:hypothetical protein